MKNKASRLEKAFEDIHYGVKSVHIWWMLALRDIKLRYRRSTLGPFWLTISMAITIYTMGLLYGNLFKMDMKEYFPHLALGLLIWTLISSILTETTKIYIESGGFIRQINLPFTIYTTRVVAKNYLIFLHNFFAVLPILLYYHNGISFMGLFSIFYGLFIIFFCAIFYGIVLGMVGARYRDFEPIITSLVNVSFFLTPIMWKQSMLPEKYKWIAEMNPFTHIIGVIREPLYGQDVNFTSLVIITFICLIGFALALSILTRARHRIAFWV